MKIGIVVHGRFHAFDLARALLRRGHDVTLFTNYPKWAVRRFDYPVERVRSFWFHGVASRIVGRLFQGRLVRYLEGLLSSMFGRWAARKLKQERWDVVHTWSGVSEESLRELNGRAALKLLMRGSAHIEAQARMLEEEEGRTGVPQDRPGPWIIAREKREYKITDKIIVLSSFARDTFINEGIDSEKLLLLPLGASLNSFRPSPEVIESRCRRILSDEPLRVLYVGALSFQKGLYDAAAVLQSLRNEIHHDRFSFRFVGQATPEAIKPLSELHDLAEFISKRPQNELPLWYAQGDLFFFPTIQDGYAVVLAQANVSGLPILTTTNCGGPDLIRDGQTGWILPIRSSESFVERLKWCDAHREELAEMVRRIYNDFQPRDWDDVAADFEAICMDRIGACTVGVVNGN